MVLEKYLRPIQTTLFPFRLKLYIEEAAATIDSFILTRTLGVVVFVIMIPFTYLTVGAARILRSTNSDIQRMFSMLMLLPAEVVRAVPSVEAFIKLRQRWKTLRATSRPRLDRRGTQ